MSHDPTSCNRWRFTAHNSSVVVETEQEEFFTARHRASSMLGASLHEMVWERTAGRPDVSLRWVGQDFNPGNPKRLQVKLRGQDWVDA